MKNGTLLLQVAGDIHDPAGIPELRGSLALDIIDGLNVGISVVGADCRVIFTNGVADRVLSADEALTISQGHLRTKDPRQRPRLTRAVRDAAVGHADGRCGSGLLLRPRASDPPLSVLVLPPRSRTGGVSPTRPIALLMFAIRPVRSPCISRCSRRPTN